MFKYNCQKIVSEKSNKISLSKVINLNENTSCFISISTSDVKIIDLILNKIVDSLLEDLTFSDKNIYQNFSASLDKINGFLKKFQTEDSSKNIDLIIGILDKNKFHFSKLGEASCHLIKTGEVTEISQGMANSEYDKYSFSFISSGDLKEGDKILISTYRILDYLTKTDILESFELENIEDINNNILENIKQENIEDNIEIINIEYRGKELTKNKNNTFIFMQNIFYKFLDNNTTKKIIALFSLTKERIGAKNKLVKNIIFISGIFVSFIMLYLIIGALMSSSSIDKNTTEFKTKLIEARKYIRLAGENIANDDIFNINIKKAENLSLEVKDAKLFLNDVEKVREQIALVKKEFNGVEIFKPTQINTIFNGDLNNSVKIITNNNKTYIIGTNYIKGPVVSGNIPKEYNFKDILNGDTFTDAVSSGNNIVLLTSNSKVASFSKNGNLKYIDVIGQAKWEKSDVINTYNRNIYLINKEKKQIYKHSPISNAYTTGSGYLKDSDLKTIGTIKDIAIDGGIYILKKDLTLLKLFVSPKYRIESILLNNLPKNYNLDDDNSRVEVIAENNLNYVYFLINNKVWVFQPNTKRYQDTRSLKYLGQIEGNSNKFKSVIIKHDGEIIVQDKNGIYKINFEVSDDKIVLK